MMKMLAAMAVLAMMLPAEAQQDRRRSQGKNRRPAQGRGAEVGKEAPNWTLKSPDGKTEVELAKLKGKPVVLIFGSYT